MKATINGKLVGWEYNEPGGRKSLTINVQGDERSGFLEITKLPIPATMLKRLQSFRLFEPVEVTVKL